MKQKNIAHFLIALALIVIFASGLFFGQKVYAEEVDASTEDTGTEATTEQEVVKEKKVTIAGITYEILSKGQKTAVVKNSAKNIKVATISPTVKINNENYKVVIIMPKAFANRKSLKKVVIGKNIKAIRIGAFKKDTKLKTVVFKGENLIVVARDAFKGTYKKVKFKIPRKVYKKYKKKLKEQELPKKAKFVKY